MVEGDIWLGSRFRIFVWKSSWIDTLLTFDIRPLLSLPTSIDVTPVRFDNDSRTLGQANLSALELGFFTHRSDLRPLRPLLCC